MAFNRDIIKLVGFDLDQTLYKETAVTRRVYRDALYKLLAESLKIPYSEAKKRFLKSYEVLGSGTEAVRVMGIKNPEKFSAEVSTRAQQHLYLKRDERLVRLIQYLKSRYTLFLITASGEEASCLKLEKMGLSPEYDFKYRIFGDSPHGGKTIGRSFRRMVELSRRKPQEHLYVGDREATDIIPAQKVGMQTAMAWHKSRIADIELPTIYDLKKII